MTGASAGNLEIEVVDQPSGQAVVVAGELDPSTAPRLRAALEAAVAGGGDVVLDLAGVTFMDSSGVAALIAAHAQLRAVDRAFVVRRPSLHVRRVLELAQLTDELTID